MRTAPGVPVRPSGEVILTVSGASALARRGWRPRIPRASATPRHALADLSRARRDTPRQGDRDKKGILSGRADILRLARPELVEGRARSGQAWVGPYARVGPTRGSAPTSGEPWFRARGRVFDEVAGAGLFEQRRRQTPRL